MDKKRELENKTNAISVKLGALFIKELLNKQYKLNYYQKIRAESSAFYKWKSLSKTSININKSNGKVSSKGKSIIASKKHLKIKGAKKNNRDKNNTYKTISMYIDKHKVSVKEIFYISLV
jgi:hypothetical protein